MALFRIILVHYRLIYALIWCFKYTGEARQRGKLKFCAIPVRWHAFCLSQGSTESPRGRPASDPEGPEPSLPVKEMS